MKIAVIGSGITGLGAAHYLSQRHDVSLFEAAPRIGGHTNTVDVQDAQAGTLAIDTGFIVCNPVNYPNFYRFLDDIGVPLQNTDMSLGVSVENGRVEWAGDENLAKIFAQPLLMFSPTHIRMLLAVLRRLLPGMEDLWRLMGGKAQAWLLRVKEMDSSAAMEAAVVRMAAAV